MFYSSNAFILLLQLLLTLSTLTQADGNDHEDNDDASCSPAEVDPSPIQHLYAEDGMEVNLITFNASGQRRHDAQYSPVAPRLTLFTLT